MDGWAAAEFAEADLGDARLNLRLIKLMTQIADNPTASIPGACGDWAETQAAYRFFDQTNNEKRPLEWQTAIQAHMDCTEARMKQHPVALCIQDTTEVNMKGKKFKGAGPLSYENQRGMYAHPTYVVTPQREPLGNFDLWMWAREFKGSDGVRPGDLESDRWLEGYSRVAEVAPSMPQTRLVYVADREADISGLMDIAHQMNYPADWLIRSKHNRCLPEGGKLWSATLAGTPLGEVEFTMAARDKEPERIVRQRLWAKRTSITTARGTVIPITCVIAKEIDPPTGCKPVTWRLVTNRDITTLEEAVELIDWYRCRWEIEILFHVVKNGCKIEDLQLDSIEKLGVAFAMYLVVSWRIARLHHFGRLRPDLAADFLFTPQEWAAAYILNKRTPPTEAPPVRDVVRLIAKLGGFLARKGDGEPGVKTFWIGMKRLRDFVTGVDLMRQLSYSF